MRKTMRGLMKMNVKLNPAIKIALAATVLLGGLWLVLRRFQIEVAVTAPETVPIIKTDQAQGETAPPTETPVATKPDPALIAARQGALRVSNRSDRPLRVALLSRQKITNIKSGEAATSEYQPPAHWDFAPREGSGEGLVVSLPNKTVTLKRGDVVVAFAQDGSQRYWGPYVVGETNPPVWDAQKGEWELVLN